MTLKDQVSSKIGYQIEKLVSGQIWKKAVNRLKIQVLTNIVSNTEEYVGIQIDFLGEHMLNQTKDSVVGQSRGIF